MSFANIVTWRLNEDARADATHASAEFRSAFDDAPTGMVLRRSTAASSERTRRSRR
jgi:hypothetical protein